MALFSLIVGKRVSFGSKYLCCSFMLYPLSYLASNPFSSEKHLSFHCPDFSLPEQEQNCVGIMDYSMQIQKRSFIFVSNFFFFFFFFNQDFAFWNFGW